MQLRDRPESEQPDQAGEMRRSSSEAGVSFDAKAGDSTKKSCVACHELIHPNARVCPHCGSTQATLWKVCGAVLKWGAGVGAVASLALATWQLRELVQVTVEKRETVAELVNAAETQRAAGQYENALAVIDEALKLDPASRNARKLRVDIAMTQVRNLGAIHTDAQLAEADAAAAALIRGAAVPDKQRTADALAHLGWLYHLRREALGEAREPIEEKIQNLFRQAHTIDPSNPFVHAFWASWCIGSGYRPRCQNEEETARDEYAKALQGGRDKLTKEFVYNMIFDYYCVRLDNDRLRDCVTFFDHMKKDGHNPTDDQRYRAWWSINEIFLSEDTFETLIKDADRPHILSTINWIVGAVQPQRLDEPPALYEHMLWSPRLKELAGQTQDAFVEYNRLRFEARKWQGQQNTSYTRVFPAIEQAVGRLLNLQPGWLGLEFGFLMEHEAARIGLQGAQHFVVRAVADRSPAAEAGIIAGDVILAVDGVDLGSRKGRFILDTAVSEQTIDLTLWRARQPENLSIVLAEIPVQNRKHYQFPGNPTDMWYLAVMSDTKLFGALSRPLPEYGVSLAELTDDLRQGYSIPSDVGGALILNNDWSMRRGSICAGDVIVEIEGRPVSGPDELIEAVVTARAENVSHVPITRFRDGKKSRAVWYVLVDQ